MPSVKASIFSAALLASFATHTFAHTWIEEYQVIGPNGSYIGDRGFSRGYVARTDPDFDGDGNILWLLPQSDAIMPDGGVRLRVNASDSLCHPNQRTSNYTDPRYPKLKASPGSFVAMKYLENGHVTLPWNQKGKSPVGGTVYVFGTTEPRDDEKIVNVMKWNKQGTGGDRRGWLLSAQNFDDGRCHQINDCTLSVARQAIYPNMIPMQNVSTEQWCESDVQMPTNLKAGTLTTYWVWQWPTAPESDCNYPDGKDEYYTTCADFDIVADTPGDVKIVDETATNTLIQENFQTAAVATYKDRTAATTQAVTVQDWGMKIAATSVANTKWAKSCAAVISAEQAAAAAGAIPAPPPSCPAGKWATGTLSEIVAQSAIAAYKAGKTTNVATLTAAPEATAPPEATGGRPGNGPAKQPPNTAGGANVETVTVTTLFTKTLTVEAGAPSGPPSSQAPAPPAGVAADGNDFPTVLTVSASAAETPTTRCSEESAMSVQNVYAGPGGIGAEHVGRVRRAHARQF
jgi:hypothetical protein